LRLSIGPSRDRTVVAHGVCAVFPYRNARAHQKVPTTSDQVIRTAGRRERPSRVAPPGRMFYPARAGYPWTLLIDVSEHTAATPPTLDPWIDSDLESPVPWT